MTFDSSGKISGTEGPSGKNVKFRLTLYIFSPIATAPDLHLISQIFNHFICIKMHDIFPLALSIS